LFDGGAHLLGIGDVGPDRDRLAARLLDLADGPRAVLLGEVEHRDGHPVGCETLGGPRADAAGGPGHDRDSLWHNVCFPFLFPTRREANAGVPASLFTKPARAAPVTEVPCR